MGRGMCRSTWATALLLAAAVAVVMPATAAAKSAKKPAKPKVVGAFYTETNGNPNKLLVFDRYSDGRSSRCTRSRPAARAGTRGSPST